MNKSRAHSKKTWTGLACKRRRSVGELVLDARVVLLAQGEQLLAVLLQLRVLLLAHVAERVEGREKVSNALLLGRPLLVERGALAFALLLLLHRLGDLGLLLRLRSRHSGLSLLAASLAQAGAVSGSVFLVALPAVHTPHVIEEVVAARETLARCRPLAIGKVAKVRACAMTMHAMGFSLVAKQARSRREGNRFALGNLAPEWLQVRVHVLAIPC